MAGFDFTTFTALIVEDNDFVRFMVKKYLTDFGFRLVHEATNGMEGLDLLAQGPDVIVCDISMEPLNGIEFLKHVRKLDTVQKNIPVIFLTSSADAETVKQAVDLNVDAYLLKPVMPHVLRAKITQSLERVLIG